MTVVLLLLALQGTVGAFDTLYYHEWKARLPARWDAAQELRLHAARDFLYATLFASLPWIAWQGCWVVVLAGILAAEIVLTLTDFVVEIRTRKPLRDVSAGERVTHAVMGMIYGAMLTNLIPVMGRWWQMPAGLCLVASSAPSALRIMDTVLGVGVALSGVRDLYATLRLPGASWPWPAPASVRPK